MVVAEARTAITTYGGRHHILVGIGVVHTSEEGDQRSLTLIGIDVALLEISSRSKVVIQEPIRVEARALGTETIIEVVQIGVTCHHVQTMHLCQLLIVGQIGLQLLVGIVPVCALSPAVHALTLQTGISWLVQAIVGRVLFVGAIDSIFQTVDEIEFCLSVCQETVTLLVVVAVGIEFHGVLRVRTREL